MLDTLERLIPKVSATVRGVAPHKVNVWTWSRNSSEIRSYLLMARFRSSAASAVLQETQHDERCWSLCSSSSQWLRPGRFPPTRTECVAFLSHPFGRVERRALRA